MKNFAILLTVLAVLVVSTSAMAGNGAGQNGGKKKKGVLHGKVEKVDGTTITILAKGAESTIQTDASTKFFLDDKPATLADVQAKQRLFASAGTGPASEVRLMTKGHKHAKADTGSTTQPV